MKLVDSSNTLADACETLDDSVIFYIDTEFESNRSGKTLSLVQLTGGSDVFIVDALLLEDLSPLARTLTREGCLWVFHAGLQDVELLQERLGLDALPRLFDTQIAWGLLSPEPSVSLAYLQYRLLGERSMKTHQADDWMRRPLPKAQLGYAAKDVEHLPEIYRLLTEQAHELGRTAAIEAATREWLAPEPEPEPDISLRSFRNAWQLDPPNQAALRFMIDWYNALPPRERRFAPSPKTFLSIASRLPPSARDLARIKGLPHRWCQAHGARFAKALMQAVAKEQGGDFVDIEPAPYASFEEIRLDGWLQYMRAEVSSTVRVAPELAFNQRILKAIRAAIGDSGDPTAGANALTGWRASVLRSEYMAFCARCGS